MKKTLLLAGVAGLFAVQASALELTPYAGVDYNYSFVNHDSSMDGVMADHAHSATAVLGSKISPVAGVEAFYQLSKKEHKANYRTQIQGYGADVLGFVPLGCYGEWELVGSAGAGWYTAKYDKDQDSGWGYRLGAGLQYNINEDVAVRAMYRHVWVDKSVLDDLNEISVGVRFNF